MNGTNSSASSNSKGRDRICLLVIFAIAVFFRLWRLESVPPGMWYDETRLLGQTAEIIQNHKFSFRFYDDEPLQGLFAVPGCLIAGIRPQGLRLGSALAGLITVVALYWFVKPIWGRRTALAAMLLLAVLPWHVIFSRIGFRAVTMPMCLVLCAGAFDGVFRLRRVNWWLGFGAFAGIGMNSYLPFVMIFPTLFIYATAIWARDRKLNRLRTASPINGKLLLGGALFVLLLAPIVIAGIERGHILHERVSGEFNPSSADSGVISGPLTNCFKAAGMLVWRGDSNPRHNTPGKAQIPFWLVPFFLGALLLAFLRPMRPRNALALAWLALFAVPTIISTECPHALRALGMVIPCAIFIASGCVSVVAFLRKRIRDRRSWLIVQVAVIIFAAGTVLGCGREYFVDYGQNAEVWNAFQTLQVDAAHEVMKLPDDAVVLMEPIFYGKLSFQFITQSRSRNIREVTAAGDFARLAPTSGPLYALFIGKDHFGAEFVKTYPKAQRIRIFTTPDGKPAAVLFKIR